MKTFWVAGLFKQAQRFLGSLLKPSKGWWIFLSKSGPFVETVGKPYAIKRMWVIIECMIKEMLVLFQRLRMVPASKCFPRMI